MSLGQPREIRANIFDQKRMGEEEEINFSALHKQCGRKTSKITSFTIKIKSGVRK
jgi:hypothetical protein